MITVVTKPDCGICNLIKNRLDQDEIPFKELILNQDITIEQITNIIGHRPKSAPVLWWNENNKFIANSDVLKDINSLK